MQATCDLYRGLQAELENMSNNCFKFGFERADKGLLSDQAGHYRAPEN